MTKFELQIIKTHLPRLTRGYKYSIIKAPILTLLVSLQGSRITCQRTIIWCATSHVETREKDINLLKFKVGLSIPGPWEHFASWMDLGLDLKRILQGFFALFSLQPLCHFSFFHFSLFHLSHSSSIIPLCPQCELRRRSLDCRRRGKLPYQYSYS